MRTPLLAALLAVSLPACIAGEITDVGGEQGGGGGGDGTGSGDGTGGGDGSGGGDDTSTPRVVATIDRNMVETELGKTEIVTVSLQSQNGFAGDVTIGARLVDAADAAMPNITMQAPTSVALAADATGTATFQIKIPMNAAGADLTGALKIDLMSSAGNESLMAAVNVKAIYTVDYAANTGNDPAKHMNTNNTPNLVVKRGAILRFHNSDTINHRIHGDDMIFAHEDAAGAAGRNYDLETIAIPPGSTGTLGCHSHGTGTYSRYRVE